MNYGALRPLMLVARPSSGNTLLSDCISQASPHFTRPPLKEWFNPIVNLDRNRDLAAFFGCETIDSYRNIAAPTSPQRAALMGGVWNPTWIFTKEVSVGYQVPLLKKYFTLVGLVRLREKTFPPSRLRVG